MPGPLVFFGAATMASFLARSAEEESADLKRSKLGLPPRRRTARSATTKDYVFETDCIDADGDDINEMRGSRAIEVSYETMLRHCDLVSWAKEHGYEARSDQGWGGTLRTDPYVSYHRSTYRGRPCYYLVWSGIEFVFTKR